MLIYAEHCVARDSHHSFIVCYLAPAKFRRIAIVASEFLNRERNPFSCFRINMTVKPVNETQVRFYGSDLQKSKEFSSPELSIRAGKLAGIADGKKLNVRLIPEKSKVCRELETDQESGGSSEEFESPKSVAKVGRWSKNIAYVHSQIVRIREEDSHIGEDIGEGLSAKDNLASGHHMVPHLDVVLFSRPILPSSPLSGKTAIKTLH